MPNITLRCADERLNEIVGKKFPDDVILAELGGVKWHLSRDTMEELYEQIEFAIAHKQAKTLNLVSHSDCGLYKELGENERDRYVDDLKESMAEITERFPELKTFAYIYDVDTKQLEKILPDDMM